MCKLTELWKTSVLFQKPSKQIKTQKTSRRRSQYLRKNLLWKKSKSFTILLDSTGICTVQGLWTAVVAELTKSKCNETLIRIELSSAIVVISTKFQIIDVSVVNICDFYVKVTSSRNVLWATRAREIDITPLANKNMKSELLVLYAMSIESIAGRKCNKAAYSPLKLVHVASNFALSASNVCTGSIPWCVWLTTVWPIENKTVYMSPTGVKRCGVGGVQYQRRCGEEGNESSFRCTVGRRK